MNALVRPHVSPLKTRHRWHALLLVSSSILAGSAAHAQTATVLKPGQKAEAAPQAEQPKSSEPVQADAGRQPATAPRSAKPAAGQDDGDAEDIIVTGVLAATAAKDANTAVAVIKREDIDRFTPISAADLLRDIPGVIVETNDGVARNEVYTRGMSIGSGGPTAGNFWVSFLEDGLPVIAAKFSGFQDNNFYREDISTDRVEAVVGGSSGVSVSNSAGGVFNFMSGRIKPGFSLRTRQGFEGENLHWSWKQLDGYYGWANKEGDLRFALTGFLRTSNGPANPGYNLNEGYQVKARMQKDYQGFGGSGTFSITFKHLDDNNASISNNVLPTYGYKNPVVIDGFGRDADLYLHGGQHMVPVGNTGRSLRHDPQKGWRYRQDAVWMNLAHNFDGPFSVEASIKAQRSSADGQQSQWNGLVSLRDANTFNTAYYLGLPGNTANPAASGAGLSRTPGFIELYDMETGTVRARIANNVAGSQLGVDYRTGAACPRVASATSPGNCVTYNDLPLRDFDLNGGVVTNAQGVQVQIPPTLSNAATDVLQATKAEFIFRESRDLMGNLAVTYASDVFRATLGTFVSYAKQEQYSWGAGFALSPYADGAVTTLGARYVMNNGTTYQLTDPGGWGKLGLTASGPSGGSNTARMFNKQLDISPYLGTAWRPLPGLDLTANVKFIYMRARTRFEQWVQNPQSQLPTARSFGGLDGNPLTWYDNFYFVPPTTILTGDHEGLFHNYSFSAGYYVTPRLKVYARYSDAQNNITGAISNRFSNNPIYTDGGPRANDKYIPQAAISQKEIGILYDARWLNLRINLYENNNRFPFTSLGQNIDGSTYEIEGQDNYLVRGVESSIRIRPLRGLDLSTSLTYQGGKTLNRDIISFGQPGTQDDLVTKLSFNGVAKLPKWLSSTTVSYRFSDFQFSLRHRAIAERRTLGSGPTDPRILPKNSNLDLSIQFAGFKNTRISLDVRNLTNESYISQIDTLLPTNGRRVDNTGNASVDKIDIYNQLPESATWVKINASRSFWLTVKHDF